MSILFLFIDEAAFIFIAVTLHFFLKSGVPFLSINVILHSEFPQAQKNFFASFFDFNFLNGPFLHTGQSFTIGFPLSSVKMAVQSG